MKITFFEEKSIFNAGFIELKYRWQQTVLVVLKNTKPLKFCVCQTFLSSFFKYHIVRDFWKLSVVHAKLIVCILFDLNMANLAQQNLISPFWDHKYIITAAHNRFQCKVFELNLTLFIKTKLISKVKQ